MDGQLSNNVIAFFSYAATALNIALAIYVLYKNPRRIENRLFALVALSLAIWAFGDAMFNVTGSPGLKAFWVRFQAPGEVLFPVFFLNLALVFPSRLAPLKDRLKAPVVACMYAPAVFALVCFYSTDWVFRFNTAPGAADLTAEGWLYWAYAFFSYALLLTALGLYVYRYYRLRRLREKRIAQVMIAAVAVPLVINIFENARLYTLSATPCFLTITAGVFAYGILRHQMFVEVERVLKRSIVYFSLTVLITSAYVVTILISERFIRSYFSAQGFIITVVFVLAAVLALEPLRRWLMKLVDKYFFRKDYEFAGVISALADSLTHLSGLDDISRRITDTLKEDMGLTGAALLYEPKEEGSWRKNVVSGFVSGRQAGTPLDVELENGVLSVRTGDGETGDFEVLEVPLVFERERVGSLALGRKLSGYEFSFNDRSLLAAIAPQVAIALKNGALYQDVLKKQQRVNELLERLAEAHEEERKRISRELHDGVAQSFLGVVYLSEFTLESLENDLEAAKHDLERLTVRAKEGLDELRRVIEDLRPIPLEVLGLKGAVSKLVGDVRAEGTLDVVFESSLPEDRELPPVVEGNLFRILQESLNNVRKHAGARKVRISLKLEGSFLTLSVADDGQGLESAGEAGDGDSTGMGMTTMRERAEEAGGELKVEEREGGGTIIRAMVPLYGEE